MNSNPHSFQQEVWTHNPDAWTTGSKNGVAVDMQKFRQAAFYANLAANGAAGTLDLKIQESNVNTGDWADIPGATITQLTADGEARIDINCDASPRKRYFRAVMVVGGNTLDAGVICIQSDPIDIAEVTAVYVSV